jgi:hypothetical protein
MLTNTDALAPLIESLSLILISGDMEVARLERF